MASIVEEKGTQLFSRFKHTSAHYNFEKNLFPSLTTQDIVEIYGESGSGKTELLYHFMVHCLLPHHWKGLKLEGSDLKVVFIDNDCHFNLFRLTSLLEARLKSFQKLSNIKISSEEISTFIDEKIKLLEIIKCYSSEQFLITLCSLETLLMFNSTKTVIMIDGITSFYWSDRMRTQNQHSSLLALHSQISATIKRISKNCNIPIFATRRKVMRLLNSDKKIFGQAWRNAVTWHLELTCDGHQLDKTVVSLFNVTNSSKYLCEIGKFGFTFFKKINEKDSS